MRIWTIGHSTHPINDFIAMLRAHEIELLGDVRHFPGSRRFPHFNRDALCESLAAQHIDYAHFPELGGRRSPRPDSRNTAWHHPAFRGYADYMETEPFHDGIARLLDCAKKQRTAIMCAEAVWWRCHRSLISDYLKARGIEVRHIFNTTKTEEHPYTSAVRIIDGELSYAGLLQ